MKKAKVKGAFANKVKLECPNCLESVIVKPGHNQWHNWFRGECWTCGWRFELNDDEFDMVQPASPFFEMIYRYNPDRQVKMAKQQHEYDEKQRHARLEEKYWRERFDPTQKHIRHRASERRALEKEILK